MYLLTKFDITAACQFEAARRMQKKNMTSTISIIVLSLYAILFALMPAFDKLQRVQDHKEILGMITIFMSASIIAFSLFEMLKRYDLRSTLFLKSARRLQELRDEVLLHHLSPNPAFDKYAEFEERYYKILTDTDDNHSNLDYDVVRVSKGEYTGLKAFEVSTIRLIKCLACARPRDAFTTNYCCTLLSHLQGHDVLRMTVAILLLTAPNPYVGSRSAWP